MVKYYNRGFLNQTEGTAAFESNITFEGEDYPYLHAGFAVSDCSRKVHLDFDCGGDGDGWENNLGKLNMLIDELGRFKEHYLEAKGAFDEFNLNTTPPKE